MKITTIAAKLRKVAVGMGGAGGQTGRFPLFCRVMLRFDLSLASRLSCLSHIPRTSTLPSYHSTLIFDHSM